LHQKEIKKMDFLLHDQDSHASERVTCVVRFTGKQDEYVSIVGRCDLCPGETTVSGLATPHRVMSGGTCADPVTVWQFKGPTRVGEVPARS
jgi:hypothetical protein